MEIDLKYKIPLVGKYNKMVYICPECDEEISNDRKHKSLFDYIMGFADSHIGNVALVECPECFTKWFYHSRNNEDFSHYEFFLEAVKNGTQKHFK